MNKRGFWFQISPLELVRMQLRKESQTQSITAAAEQQTRSCCLAHRQASSGAGNLTDKTRGTDAGKALLFPATRSKGIWESYIWTR